MLFRSEQLDSLTQALLKSETLEAKDAYAAAGVPMRPEERQEEAAVSAAR